ncbi:penicillin-binding protein A [Anaerosalibacter bizertensis]|uniref:peptidoglycan D,D-transpeptidase FtsI family protein n=1 Tax=Anaerosalibacter bizertensis TaxID=932217 RepID=UPI001C0EE518|nr:penicillin-binding transpeptidase domain-containing protein [Anaerosalibacter bizertensis]MBU5294674.1 penicillin-binding protein A [Anaerosalibacter bizertensis]
MNKEVKRMARVLIAMCLLFTSLIVYLSYFQIFTAPKIKNNSFNKRLWIDEENILRGMILDRNGKTLAYSEKTEDSTIRHYNYGSLYSHIIGYSYRDYGKSGLELTYNNELLNLKESTTLKEISKIIKPDGEGNNIKLTLDHELQEIARNSLKGKKGSIVAMNPQNGEIYAMVSQPDFDPNTMKQNWQSIVENPDSPFLNRATSGLYAPGSIFKVVTAVAGLENPNVSKSYDCKGSFTVEGYTLEDYGGKAHGKLGLEEALVKSCNSYFAQLGLQVGRQELGGVSERFMMNKDIPFDLPVKASKFAHGEELKKTDIAASSIGQGKTLVTPLNMAMVASAIGNEGNMVKPILVKEILSPKGHLIKLNDTETISQVTDPLISNQVKNMMVEVVKRGTGTNASIGDIRVAGKTGTAENPTGKSHAWFIGFAPADEPKIAISVILESDGTTGGKTAAPIARQIMIEGLNRIK